MEEPFILDVVYRGNPLEFTGKLLLLEYIHKIEVDVNGIMVFFEPDQEPGYRACVTRTNIKGQHPDNELVSVIACQLECLLI